MSRALASSNFMSRALASSNFMSICPLNEPTYAHQKEEDEEYVDDRQDRHGQRRCNLLQRFHLDWDNSVSGITGFCSFGSTIGLEASLVSRKTLMCVGLRYET